MSEAKVNLTYSQRRDLFDRETVGRTLPLGIDVSLRISGFNQAVERRVMKKRAYGKQSIS